MSPLEVMKRTSVPLALYSPAGEVSGVTDGNGLLVEKLETAKECLPPD